MELINSVFEFAWLATQQIIVTSDNEAIHIKGFGSGFFFQYRDRTFLVTADHVTHLDDFDAGIRIGKDDYVWVLNNKNSTRELATMLTPIGGIYSFDLLDINDELSFEIPDMKDISFAILPDTFKYPFLTHELRIEDQVMVQAGKEKVIIKSECAAELKETDYCLIEGCVQCNIIDGIKLSRCNAIYQDLVLDSVDSDGYYIMKYSNPIVYNDWAGLSGGPVFTDKFRLIGMLIEVSKVNDDKIKVVPINKITELMDYAITYEESVLGQTRGNNV